MRVMTKMPKPIQMPDPPSITQPRWSLITVTTPAYMAPMISDHRGWVMLGGSGIWMGFGIFVMTRMINFKF